MQPTISRRNNHLSLWRKTMSFVVDKESQLFEKLLDPKFNWKEIDDYTILTGLGESASSVKKNSNRILGKLAIILEKSDKTVMLKDFAKDINVPPNSLRVYKSVEKAFEGFAVPADISWTVLLVMIGQEEPKKSLQEALDHGLSNPEIIKTYGKVRHKEKIVCPKCGETIKEER